MHILKCEKELRTREKVEKKTSLWQTDKKFESNQTSLQKQEVEEGGRAGKEEKKKEEIK